MCDPLTIAGLALTAGSTVANSMAANKVAKARSNVMSAERERQAKYDKEAQAINATSQNRYQTFGADMGKRGQELGDYFANSTIPTSDAAGVPTEVMPQSDSVITQEETAKQQANAGKYVGQQAKALGNLRSFGDYLGGVSRQQGREAGLIGQIGGYKKGSGEVVPFELDAASHAGDKLKMFGDVLALGGQAATGKGLQGDWKDIAGGTNPVTLGVGPATGPWGADSGLRMPSLFPKPRSSLTVADLGLAGRYGGPR